MLELKNIVKDYITGENVVRALRGVDLKFRESEFVSVLGPSGCGKTTLLNIIGGLDKYTSGDLIINGRSTKDYNDRDWDAYRNHSIGFVFQSYNLIPHQTVLQNVEIALTVSGVGKAERRRRAVDALEQVGLYEQRNKRPNQLSGGQMQRIAIARALVNNPDIILADEPTGALDTQTSVQIMEILKGISKDHLIIMVTHNPELAQKYSSRIINILDGEITSDTAPVTEDEYKVFAAADSQKLAKRNKKEKKPSMSFFTAFKLSLKNLFTKKGRTTLTAFAGSIGIMGIALILSVSQGTSAYIDATQEDSLSSYPLTIEKTSVDLATLMETFMDAGSEKIEHGKDAVYNREAIYNILTALNNIESKENDLKSFKKYLEKRYYSDGENTLKDAVNGIQYSYDLGLLVYTENVDGNIIKSDTTELMQEIMAEYTGSETSSLSSMGQNSIMGKLTSSFTRPRSLWQEMITSRDGGYINDLLKKQYDVVYGSWPKEYDEVVLVLDKNNELDDVTLYALGLQSKENVDKIMSAAMNGTKLEKDIKKWSYKDICNTEFRVILNSDCYTKDEATGLYTDLRDTDAGLQYLYNNALKLKIVGIVRQNPDAQSGMLTGNIAYTKGLTDYVINKAGTAQVIADQQATPSNDVITGLPFAESTGVLSSEEKETAFRSYVANMNVHAKAKVYIGIMSIPEDNELQQMVDAQTNGLTREKTEQIMVGAMTEQIGMDQKSVKEYIAGMSDEELEKLFEDSVTEQVKARYAENVKAQFAGMDEKQLSAALDAAIKKYDTAHCAKYYDEVLEFSDSTLEENLAAMGYVDTEFPTAVNIYASSFENKETIENAIKEYNKDKEELEKIEYNDLVGIMMSSITTIINAITYVLLAFVAISLLVSSIMIGVITLISVQERTKEIGILRAIGASKRDISSMFNAETVIIGFASGILGVGITYLLCIPINIILQMLTGINTLRAYLPLGAAAVLVAISILLSLFAGIIPSRSAAKKDPVVALRTE